MSKTHYDNYAIALFSLAKEENAVATYKKDALYVLDVLSEHPDLVEVLSSYSVSLDHLTSIVDEVFGNLKSHQIPSLLKLLIEKHLIKDYRIIFGDFLSRCNADLGVKEGIIYSVEEMSKSDIKKAEESLAEKLDCEVNLENRIDHSLMGGYVVSLEGKVYDASIKGRINRLKTALSRNEGGTK